MSHILFIFEFFDVYWKFLWDFIISQGWLKLAGKAPSRSLLLRTNCCSLWLIILKKVNFIKDYFIDLFFRYLFFLCNFFPKDNSWYTWMYFFLYLTLKMLEIVWWTLQFLSTTKKMQKSSHLYVLWATELFESYEKYLKCWLLQVLTRFCL